MFDIAYASTTGTTGAGTGMGSTIMMIVLMIAIFYFLMIRPENKRKKQAEEMRNSLKKGDWLTTIGGVYGRVVSITDRTVVIETSEDRVRVEFLKSAIVLAPGWARWTSRPPPSSVPPRRTRRPTRLRKRLLRLPPRKPRTARASNFPA